MERYCCVLSREWIGKSVKLQESDACCSLGAIIVDTE